MGKGSCGGSSRVMIVIDPRNTTSHEDMLNTFRKSIDHVTSAELAEGLFGIKVPGDGMRRFRKEHDKLGIYVDDGVWEKIRTL